MTTRCGTVLLSRNHGEAAGSNWVGSRGWVRQRDLSRGIFAHFVLPLDGIEAV
jgi:hypothetical protein